MRAFLVAMATAAISAMALAADLDVPLTVVEPSGIARTDEPVSGGIPLPVGLVKDPATLKLVDDKGAEVPAQFSASNRWGADQSVMWLLVQAQATVPAKGSVVYHLKSGAAAAKAASPVKVTDAADAITVETGKIKFTVSKKRFNLIDSASITAGGKDEQVIAPGNGGGSTLTLAADGGVYSSRAEAPQEVVVEESGPMRATIMVRGLHKPEGGKGKLPYLYGYVVRIRAFGGEPFVRISYALTNGHLPAIGSPLCRNAIIAVPLSDKLGKPADGDGWIAASNDKSAISLVVRYLKENAPARLVGFLNVHSPTEGQAVVADGVNTLALLPWGDKEDYLDICSHKTYEMQLTLDPAAKGDDLLKRFDGYLRFWCEPSWVNETKAWSDFGCVSVPDDALKANMVRRFQPYRLAGWRDFGSDPEFESGSSSAPGGGYEPLLKTAPFYLGYLQTNDRRMFDQLERTSWHWRDRRYIYLDGDWAGKKWEGGGGVYKAYYDKGAKDFPDVQPANYGRYGGAWNYGGRYGPMDTQHFSVDEVVNYFYLTGDRQCLEALRMYGNEAASFTAAFTGVKGHVQVSRAHGWVARALANVYEATGEKRYLDLTQAAVKAICENQDKTAGTISPVAEKTIDPKTKQEVYAGHTPFMAAAVGMALGRYYRHYPEEDVRDAILGIADWLAYDVAGADLPNAGFSYHWSADKPEGRSGSGNRCMSTMAWAYLATGQSRYLAAADKHAGKLADWYSNGFGQEYVYIKTTKRADATPPAAVKYLAAEAVGGGKVKLTWTAPGDDGDKGAAAEYQVKYSTKQIKEHCDWRTEADKAISFWAAVNCKGEPKPSPAGAKESFTAEGLAPGTYWFALKVYDAQPNQSDLSNVVKVDVK
ncbi:MAG: glycoside hydrolase family 127 protein [Phycisphaerae bacterium]|nr:glycoside hydrolase family 127 protein [Phycisphaerae bacterium]